MAYVFKNIPKIKINKWAYLGKIQQTEVPYFLSYPRSGCHWLNALFELYFNRVRGPRNINEKEYLSFVDKKDDEEYMWYQTHDRSLLQHPSESEFGDIFLFRNPIHCIYSLSVIEGNTNNKILEEAEHYKNLMEKWIDEVNTIIIYEYAVENPYKCLEIISKHFKQPYNKERAELAVRTCTKEAIMSKLKTSKYHNTTVLSKEYQDNRIKFEKNYGPLIRDITTTNITKPWLEKVYKHNLLNKLKK